MRSLRWTRTSCPRTGWHGKLLHGMAQHDVTWQGTAWHDEACRGEAQHGMTWRSGAKTSTT
eukprot:365365-Chlamydomonas_euryale.AAC.13